MNLLTKTSCYGILGVVTLLFVFAACDQNKPVVPEGMNNVQNTGTTAFPQDSFAYYENILVKDSMNVELRMALATNYYSERLFEKAIDHLLKVVRIDSKNKEALTTLGNVYYDAGQNENAVIYYEKLLALDNKNVNVRCDLATCYLNLKQPEKSLSLLKKNLEIDPNHAQSHHNLSVVYGQLGRTKEAEEQMKVFNSLKK
jgi:tetratricopeptide (TPR) repeat protein